MLLNELSVSHFPTVIAGQECRKGGSPPRYRRIPTSSGGQGASQTRASRRPRTAKKLGRDQWSGSLGRSADSLMYYESPALRFPPCSPRFPHMSSPCSSLGSRLCDRRGVALVQSGLAGTHSRLARGEWKNAGPIRVSRQRDDYQLPGPSAWTGGPTPPVACPPIVQ